MIAEMSTTWSDYVVGGSVTTPYLLADRDDGGRWDADEAWMLEPAVGLVIALPRVADGFGGARRGYGPFLSSQPMAMAPLFLEVRNPTETSLKISST